MSKYLTFFVILAVSLGIMLWVVRASKQQTVLGTASDPEIESLQRDINGL